MMYVSILTYTPEPEWLIAYAGRVCYRSGDTDDDQRFIKRRIEQGHQSILEHASVTFEIGGISRACSHQLVRHRIASFSQESQRYVYMTGDSDVVIPPKIQMSESERIFYDAIDASLDAYRKLVQAGVPREDARFVLPNAMATRLVTTMNFRELRHFFDVRLTPQAQWEIKEVAKRMLHSVKAIAPSVFEDIEVIG